MTELIISRLTTQSPLPGPWDTISGLGKGYGSYNPGFQAVDESVDQIPGFSPAYPMTLCFMIS